MDDGVGGNALRDVAVSLDDAAKTYPATSLHARSNRTGATEMVSGTTTTGTLIAAYNERDLERVASSYTPDARVHPDGWFEAVDVLTWIDAFRSMTVSFPDLFLSAEHVTAGPGLMMMEVRLTGTNTGPLYLSDLDRLVLATDADALPPTGHSIELTGAVVLQTAHGLVRAERHYWRQIDSLAQLGLGGLARRSR